LTLGDVGVLSLRLVQDGKRTASRYDDWETGVLLRTVKGLTEGREKVKKQETRLWGQWVALWKKFEGVEEKWKVMKGRRGVSVEEQIVFCKSKFVYNRTPPATGG